MADLASLLSDQLGQPVGDATGLNGRYDYSLSFLMDPGGRAATPDEVAESESAVSLIDAVKEQLGLVLRKRKFVSDVLVVDSAEETPKEN